MCQQIILTVLWCSPMHVYRTLTALYFIAMYELFANYTAWKWQPEKKNHDLAPELAVYALTWSFSHASHQCGRDSSSSIVYTVMGSLAMYVRYRKSVMRSSNCQCFFEYRVSSNFRGMKRSQSGFWKGVLHCRVFTYQWLCSVELCTYACTCVRDWPWFLAPSDMECFCVPCVHTCCWCEDGVIVCTYLPLYCIIYVHPAQYVLMHVYTRTYVRTYVHCHVYLLIFASWKCGSFIDTSPLL